MRLAVEADEGPLWVFAYGSLIWKPEFKSVEQRLATAFGWHRSFCLDMVRWRGSAAQPGLMMALERGGRCNGVIYRCRTAKSRPRSKGCCGARSATMKASARSGGCRCGYGARRAAGARLLGWREGYGGHRRTSLWTRWRACLARACGHIGSGAEYLYNTVSHLEAFGIHDRNLWRLQELVAEEVRAIHGGVAQPLARAFDVAAAT